MDALAKCLIPLRCQPDSKRKDVIFLVDPPTVRQVVLLDGLLPFFAEKNYEARIRAVMKEWLGGSGLLEYLEEEGISWTGQVKYLEEILKGCDPDPKDPKDPTDGLWAREQTLAMMIAEYRYWFHVDVMNEPWPFFLNQVDKLEQLRAELGLANFAWYIAGKSPESYEDLMKRAGYRKGAATESETLTKEDQKMQLDNASAIGQMMALRGQGGQA